MTTVHRLIACDLDGTLLNSRSAITGDTIQRLRAALPPGTEFTICTGREQYSVAQYVNQLALIHVPVITETGAVIQDPGDWRVLVERDLGGSVVRQVLDHLAAGKHDFNFFLSRGKEFLVYKNETAPFFLQDTLYSELNSQFQDIGAWHSHDVDGFRKIAIRCRRDETDALERELEALLRGTATIMKSDVNCLDIMGEGVSKGSAVVLLADMLGVDMKNVMAVGDNETDASMFGVAGVSVAMANGDPETVRMARYVAPSNDEGGVVAAVQRFVSGEYHA